MQSADAAGRNDQMPSPIAAVQISDTEYLRQNNVHVLLDAMVRQLLREKPSDSKTWMMRWFLEQHRRQCEERYRNHSPQHRPRRGSASSNSDDVVGSSQSAKPTPLQLEE